MERLHACYNALCIQQIQCLEQLSSYSNSNVRTLASDLFNSSTLKFHVAHSDAPYPMQFLCYDNSSSSKLYSSYIDEFEARIMLDQALYWINKLSAHRRRAICIICSTRQQVVTVLQQIHSSFI